MRSLARLSILAAVPAFLAAAFTAGFASPAAARDGLMVVGPADALAMVGVLTAPAPGAPAGKPMAKETLPAKQAAARFCDGIGEKAADLLATMQALTQKELATCSTNGVSVTEVLRLRQVLVLVRAAKGEPIAVTRGQLWRGLAARLPIDGKIVANPHMRWADVDPFLLANPIKVLGPAATQMRRKTLAELALRRPCEAEPAVANLPREQREPLCTTLRSDAAWIDAPETDDALAAQIVATPDAVGVTGYATFASHREDVDAVPIDGVEVDAQSIASGDYPLARPFYIYVKREHVGIVAGLKEALAALVSPATLDPAGRVAPLDLMPLSADEMEAARQRVTGLVRLQAQGS